MIAATKPRKRKASLSSKQTAVRDRRHKTLKVNTGKATAIDGAINSQRISSPRRPIRHARTSLPSSHAMRTRSRTMTFNFFDLPAEVRNIVYALACERTPTQLADLRLPRSLCVPGILTEALPFYFETTPLIVTARSNWCVRYQHLHNARDHRFARTGQVQLPRLLWRGDVPEELVRFRDVTIEAGCCCCDESRAIARVSVKVGPQDASDCLGKLVARVTLKEVVNRDTTYDFVVEGLDEMLSRAVECVQRFDRRGIFNGLTIQDIKKLAMTFRDTKSGYGGDHGSNGE